MCHVAFPWHFSQGQWTWGSPYFEIYIDGFRRISTKASRTNNIGYNIVHVLICSCGLAVCLVFEWRIKRRIQSTCGQRQGVRPARDVGKRAPKSSAGCRVRAGKPPALVCSVYRSKELEDILEVGKIAFYFVCLSSDLLPFLLCARMSNSKAVDGK